MQWHLDEVARPLRTLVLASTAGHCVNDLLFRQRAGQLPVEIPLVLSNHGTLRDLVDFYGVPFESLAVTDAGVEGRVRGDACSTRSTSTTSSSWCSPATCRSSRPSCATALAGRCINIHHSFLPGFKGANPYRQAHARGVKLIGATAHFVTSDLDEGPIIEQNVVRVDHSRSPERARRDRPRRGEPHPQPGGEVVRRAPGAARRRPHDHLPLSAPVGLRVVSTRNSRPPAAEDRPERHPALLPRALRVRLARHLGLPGLPAAVAGRAHRHRRAAPRDPRVGPVRLAEGGLPHRPVRQGPRRDRRLLGCGASAGGPSVSPSSRSCSPWSPR